MSWKIFYKEITSMIGKLRKGALSLTNVFLYSLYSLRETWDIFKKYDVEHSVEPLRFGRDSLFRQRLSLQVASLDSRYITGHPSIYRYIFWVMCDVYYQLPRANALTFITFKMDRCCWFPYHFLESLGSYDVGRIRCILYASIVPIVYEIKGQSGNT